MSAWLCENKTLSLVVDIIKSDEFQAYDDECYGLKDTFELMCLLSNLNTKSLDCRYGYSEDHILKNIRYIPLDVSDAQRHKSVRCYLYQTCECSENEEHPLFKALEEWSDDTYDKFEPEHDKCEWDIDNPIH